MCLTVNVRKGAILTTLLLLMATSVRSATAQSAGSPRDPTYEVRGLPSDWAQTELVPQQLNWDDFGDRHTWSSGSSLLVLARGLNAQTLACPELRNGPEGTADALQMFRSSTTQTTIRVGGRRLLYLRPGPATAATTFLNQIDRDANTRWESVDGTASAILDCDRSRLLIGTGRFAKQSQLVRRWNDPGDRGRILLTRYAAPNEPTIYPNQIFSRRDGRTLSVALTIDPRSTAGIAFGAADTVVVRGMRSRSENGTITFSLCRGVAISLTSGLPESEMVALADSLAVALRPGIAPSLEFAQNRARCRLWPT